MASRRKLNHFTEQELEELLHAPATTGLRNVLSFGRKTQPDESTPGDVSSPGDSRDTAPSGVETSSGGESASDATPAPDQDVAAGAVASPGVISTPGTGSRRPWRDGQLAFHTGDGQPADPRRVQRATSVQQGHSPTEHLLYQILYDLGTPAVPGAASRETQIGYDRLSRHSGITKRNIIPIMHRLEQKLAIEVIQIEDSARGIGRRYRVYGTADILERRARAGLLYVIRHKGVDFVFPASRNETSPGDV